MTNPWTEGVCGDGAVILRDGVPASISDVLAVLNAGEGRDPLLDAVADLLLAMHPLGFLNRMEIGRLVGCVRALREASAGPVPDFSVARDAWRGRGGC